jgi:RNA polymerase sigma-70 factor, ECF subfamily
LNNTEPTDTARLVERARDARLPLSDQDAAFTRLVESSQHLAFGLALSLLHDADDARDATQEAYLTAWRRLRQLRDPAAFSIWLKTIVSRECKRRARGRSRRATSSESWAVDADTSRLDYQAVVASALTTLSDGERDVTLLYYFLGYTQPQIARLLGLKPGTVAKRLHSARLRLRRQMPASVRHEFVRAVPTAAFAAQVRRGLYDEYVGEYWFAERPGAPVTITREDDRLISSSNGQRHILAATGDAAFATVHYDGMGRFGRDGRGAISHFTYYEFGKRMGVARKR